MHLPLQVTPQAPQFASSFLTLTQAPSHILKPPGQAQAPSEQTWPLSHLLPQPPQLAGLEVVLVHCGGSPHAAVLAGHTQLPAVQTVPPEQTMPQPPQLLPSAPVSTQAPAQFASPAAQSLVQLDCEQTSSVAQALVQAPQ